MREENASDPSVPEIIVDDSLPPVPDS